MRSAGIIEENMTGDKHEGCGVSLERDEHKARFEAKLVKIAAVRPVRRRRNK